ncbi:MAG: hypothetical protein ACYDFT_07990 [Thermoplasmata archaeon]
MDRTELAGWARELPEGQRLGRAPVQISSLETAPEGVHPPGGAPSVGTLFAEGTERPFYAALSEHAACEVGAFVLGIPPEGALGDRLQATLGQMVAEGYLPPEEIAPVPHHARAPRFVAYGPLGQLPMAPSGVLLFARPKAAILLLEAAGPSGPLLGRPMGSIVPTLLGGAPVAASAGCVGARLYAGLEDDLMVVGLRGDYLPGFFVRFRRVLAANRWLAEEDGRRRTAAEHPYHAAAPAGAAR